MTSSRPLACAAATVGLVLAGLTVSAAPVSAATATAPTCDTSVSGVLSNGKVVDRWLKNASLDREHESATPLPFAVSSMVFLGYQKITGGVISHLNTFTTGATPRVVDQTRLDASTTLTDTVSTVYSRTFSARLVAGSGSYYVYGVDGHGNLKRWTRESDSAGHVWFGAAKLVARHMGGLRTLSYSWTFKIDGGWQDVLYGTTRSGALKQVKVSWRRPGNAKVTTVKRSGFASYTGLSLSFCNSNPKYLSIIAIDRVHNRARWYTLRRSLTPRAANLARHGLAAPGSDWRLHATF